MQAAVRYLANETLRYWYKQAKQRRITTPSPASVRWSWASAEVAVPAQELQPDPPVVSGGLVPDQLPRRLLTAGVVTELREQLYECLDGLRRRIVVLGGPGAGKTAALLLLLIDILEHRPLDSDEPVPVWLSLGGWNPQASSLRDWAAATLARDYPGLSAPAHGGEGTAAELIRTGRVALFLDGLDEMPPVLQGPALTSIDRDAAGLKVVLTSRPHEYQAALTSGRLYGAAVIDVLPVDVQDATEFLLAEQLGQRRREWQQVTDHVRDQPDSVAARTLTTPLALSLARDTYTNTGYTPTDLLSTDTHPTPNALLQHLLARSVTLAYPDPAERAHATRWLCGIAKCMGSNRDLLWWDIPTWTPQWQLRLVFGLFAVLVGGLAGGLTEHLAIGLANGLAAGLTFWVVEWRSRATAPQNVYARRRRDLVFALVFIYGLVLGITHGLPYGVASGLAAGLVERGSTPLATAHAVGPLDIYRIDRRRALAFGLVSGFVGGLVFGLGGLVGGLVFGLVSGLAVGLVLGLAAGFGPVLRLTVVQMIWCLRGQPVRFIPLLQTALHRQILRQAGAVYQFRHAVLQDFLRTR